MGRLAGFFLALNLLSAVMVIFSAQQLRQTTTALYQGQQNRDQIQVQWGQLMLEKNSLSSLQHVERYAYQHLRMKLPEAGDMKRVSFD